MNKCAFDKDGKCSALNKKDCKGCSFYKTEEEVRIGREKATARIKTLPKDIQRHIKLKYYSRGRVV